MTIQLKQQINLFAEQGKKILQLEGTIKGLEAANSGLSETNKELQHEIDKLKNELELAKKNHKTMQEKLDREIVKLTNKNKDLTINQNKLKTQNKEWQTKSNIIKTTIAIGALGGPPRRHGCRCSYWCGC